MSGRSELANGDSLAFREGARNGRLMLQRCPACGEYQFPPRLHCAACWDGTPEWVASAGKGAVESFTIVRRAPLPAFRDEVPYVVAAIHLQEGPRMIASIVGDGALDVRIGDRVEVGFRDEGDGTPLPVFRRV